MSIRTIPKLRHALERLGNLILPQCCCLCEQSGGPFCTTCERTLPRPPAARCPACADASPCGALCGACLSKPPHFSGVSAPFAYAWPIDQLLQAYKYGHRLRLARPLAMAMADAAPAGCFRVAVIPASAAHLRERGFNAAALLGQHVAAMLNLPLSIDTLVRLRETSPQAALPYRQRQRNIRGAFASSAPLNGERVMLIDDVMTSGATVREASRVLIEAGAAEVRVLVAARTDHSHHRQRGAAPANRIGA